MTVQTSWNSERNSGKGELLVGNALRPAVLTVPFVDGYVLTTDTAQPQGVAWGPPSGGGGSAAFAWALITIAGGPSVSLDSGFNMASVSVAGATITFNFSVAAVNANLCTCWTSDDLASNIQNVITRSTTSVQINTGGSLSAGQCSLTVFN